MFSPDPTIFQKPDPEPTIFQKPDQDTTIFSKTGFDVNTQIRSDPDPQPWYSGTLWNLPNAVSPEPWIPPAFTPES